MENTDSGDNYNLTNSGTITVGTGSFAANIDGTFTNNGVITTKTITKTNSLGGSYSNGANSLVTFIGDGDTNTDSYTITGWATTYYDLTINSTDGVTDTFVIGNTLTVNDDLTVTAGTIDFDGRQLNITGDLVMGTGSQVLSDTDAMNGADINVSGALDLDGESGDKLTFKWTAAWALDVSGAADMDYVSFATTGSAAMTLNILTGITVVSYTDAEYSNAVGSANPIDASDGTCTDNNNNVFWDFGGSVIWDGSDSTNWSTDANWAAGFAPESSADVLIPDCTSISAPHLTEPVSIASLTLQSGGKLYLDGYKPTVSGSVLNAGTIYLYGNEDLTGVTNLGIANGTVEYIGTGGSGTFNIADFGAHPTADYFNLKINGAAAETFRVQDTKTLTVAGDFTLTQGVFDNGTYAEYLTMTGASKTLTSSSGRTIDNLTVTGSVSISGTLEIETDLKVTGTGSLGGAGTLTILDSASISQKDSGAAIDVATLNIIGAHNANIAAAQYNSASVNIKNDGGTGKVFTGSSGTYTFTGNVNNRHRVYGRTYRIKLKRRF